MEKDFYTAKEIIMGTRSAYQKNEEYLRKLKDMVYSNDKEVKDLYFGLVQYLSYKSPEIICYFEQNEKTLRGLLWKLEMKLGTYIYGRDHTEIRKDTNGKYQIGNYHFNAHIKEGMEEEFDSLIEEMLSSDFVTKMGFDCLNKRGTPEDIYLGLDLNKIEIHTFNLENISNWLDYWPNGDYFYAYGRNIDIDDETIYRMLNFKMPKESFSDYHRQIIESNPSTYKRVEVSCKEEDIDKRNFKILINETDDKITLTKTKIRKR